LQASIGCYERDDLYHFGKQVAVLGDGYERAILLIAGGEGGFEPPVDFKGLRRLSNVCKAMVFDHPGELD